MRHREVLTDQNSAPKTAQDQPAQDSVFPNVLRPYIPERRDGSAGNVDADVVILLKTLVSVSFTARVILPSRSQINTDEFAS